ncbi:fatty acid desaturase [Catellatospora sichuanensis]|uniref:fatty acid desaturase n=1 Tax=Catellatospora sichuanensis TaxID=1969805 RepID=UPI00118273B2|nr:fatty acid desaturase [Catellatospora sichuanensis]
MSTVETVMPGLREDVRPRETMRALPRILQPFLTWVTGVPLDGDRQFVSWSPAKAAVLGLIQTAAGISLGAYLLSGFTPWSIPPLVLSLLLTTGGLRRLDVVVVHQTLHQMFVKSVLGNRIVGELITTMFWRTPYDEDRRDHLLHHQYPCSMHDSDTRYLLATGMRPGMSKSEFRRYLWKSLFSPKHHWGFFSGRIRSNFIGVRPRYRLLMSLVWLASTVVFVATTGWWMQYLVLWLLPLSVMFQGSTYLYTHTEHRWWIFANSDNLTKAQRDLLTFGRVCGEATPGADITGRARRAAAWLTWWSRILFVHAPYRMFILVGDTVQHDLHHIAPKCDWANSAYVRRDDIAKGSPRYTEVWGSLVDHLHAAGMVGEPAPLGVGTDRSSAEGGAV